MTMVEGIEAQAHQVFRNLRAVATAAAGGLDDIVKLSILMVDLGDFAKVNDIMAGYFAKPYPARATYQVAALPRGALIEVEGDASAVLPAAQTVRERSTGDRHRPAAARP